MRKLAPAALFALATAAYWVAVWWLFVASTAMCKVTGACQETGHVYGSLSGFSGTVLFSVLMLAPPWYYQHTCRDSRWCVRWGSYPDSRGVTWCWKHHPDHNGQRPTGDFLRHLHHEHKQRGA